MKCIVLLVCSLVCPLFAAEPIRVLVWDEQQPEQKQGYGEKFLGEATGLSLVNRGTDTLYTSARVPG